MRCGSVRRRARSRAAGRSSGSPVQASTILPNNPGPRGNRRRTARPRRRRCSATSIQRGSLGPLVRRRHRGHPRRGARTRRSRPACPRRAPGARRPHLRREPGPAHEASPIRWPSRRLRSKTSTVPARPNSAEVCVERRVQVGQIDGHVVAPKQLARQHATPGEDLVGQLAPQHQVVGHALAGGLLGQRVERLHTGGREREQIVVPTAFHRERVAVSRAGRADGGDGIADGDVPRQTGSRCVGRSRNRVRRHRGSLAAAASSSSQTVASRPTAPAAGIEPGPRRRWRRPPRRPWPRPTPPATPRGNAEPRAVSA